MVSRLIETFKPNNKMNKHSERNEEKTGSRQQNKNIKQEEKHEERRPSPEAKEEEGTGWRRPVTEKDRRKGRIDEPTAGGDAEKGGLSKEQEEIDQPHKERIEPYRNIGDDTEEVERKKPTD